ncbi:early endosome antigen 1 isoform X1 [Hydra vulgaris]|uniref:early endosome antigen 1 isoform X1 n=1 Tax=Hydra vulgaris TaxID=6087 RepID=UPI001F5FD66E|nr:early endosome antigen 1 isoform X1 [Hydra vulgaris]
MKLMNAFTIVVISSVASGWSTLEKPAPNNKLNQEAAGVLEACSDAFESCYLFANECGKRSVKLQCPKTCGLCRAVYPMSCHASEYGCCWDSITLSGPNGDGCPVCEDKLSGCPKLKYKCFSDAVKQACPFTCNVKDCVFTSGHCEDDPQQAHYCELFKNSGFCQNDIPLMVKVCKKTCDLCAYVTNPDEANPAKKSEEDELIEKLQKQVEDAIAKKQSNFEPLFKENEPKIDTKANLQEFLEEKIRQEKLEQDKKDINTDLTKKSQEYKKNVQSESTNKEAENTIKQLDTTMMQGENNNKKSEDIEKHHDSSNTPGSNKEIDQFSIKIISVEDKRAEPEKKESKESREHNNNGLHNIIENSNVTVENLETEKEAEESLLELIKKEQKKNSESASEILKRLNEVVDETKTRKFSRKDPVIIKNSETDTLLKMIEDLPLTNMKDIKKSSANENEEIINTLKEKMNSEKLERYQIAKMEEDAALLQLLEKDEATKKAAQDALNSITSM